MERAYARQLPACLEARLNQPPHALIRYCHGRGHKGTNVQLRLNEGRVHRQLQRPSALAGVEVVDEAGELGDGLGVHRRRVPAVARPR